MRDRTYWQNKASKFDNKYNVVPSPTDGPNVNIITKYGEVIMQDGTPQDAAHFNSVEESLVALEATAGFLLNYARQNAWEIEKGTITLTNSAKYPFNNSQQTVALKTRRENGDYAVIVMVDSSVGNIGEIEISEKLVNGFKLAYTGSATSAKISYQIIGGFLK